MTPSDLGDSVALNRKRDEDPVVARDRETYELEDRLLFEQTIASVARALNSLPNDIEPLRDIRQELDCLAVVLGYDRCIFWSVENLRAHPLARHERPYAILERIGNLPTPDSAPWLFAAVGELRKSVVTARGGIRTTAGIAPRGPRETAYVLHVEIADAGVPWAPFADARRVALLCELMVATLRRAHDARDLRRLRDVAARADNASRLGQLAAGIAHEVNQPLAATLCNVQAVARMLEQPTPDLDEIRAAVQDAVRTVRRAGDVVRRVRALFGQDVSEYQTVELSTLLAAVGSMVRLDMSAVHAKFHVDVAPGLPTVKGDPVQLQQMLVNLLNNALDAVRYLPLRHRRVSVAAERDPTGAARIVVEDEGVGLPENHTEDLFQPFFTTKAKGIGMGLPICRQIAEAHGGTIHAETRSPRGSRFIVTLPAG